MQFAYLRDPLFLVCVAAYLANRWVLKAIWADGFVHEHFNDLICIGLCVPPMLFAARRLSLRRHDGPPDAVEIVVPLLVWSLMFEVLLPSTEMFSPWAHADHRDVAWYAAGGLIASLFWNWHYRRGDAASVKSADSAGLTTTTFCATNRQTNLTDLPRGERRVARYGRTNEVPRDAHR